MKRLSLVCLAVMSITACGGGSSSSDNTIPDDNVIVPVATNVSISVDNFRRTGLQLQVSESGNTETIMVDAATGQSAGSFAPGQELTVSVVAHPAGQQCEVTNPQYTVTESETDGISVACSDIQYQLNATLTDAVKRSASLMLSNGETLELAPGQPMVAAASFIYDETLSVTFTAPFGYRCELAQTEFSFQGDVAINISDCAGVGNLSGLVSSYGDGNPLDQAQITLRVEQNGQWVDLDSAVTDSNGMYSIDAIGAGNRYAVSVERSGYLVNGQTVSNSEQDPNLTVNSVLQIGVASTNFEQTEAVVLADSNTQLVSIPASALVTKSGAAVEGTISAAVTVIDPSTDPNVMPGEYMAWNAETESSYQIESFGAISVDLFDQAGERLTLAENETAQIRIPVAAAISSPPTTMPLYYFDTDIAQWVQEGEAQLVTIGGESYYQGEVSHFTVWNADRPLETVFIEGCVEDDAGGLIANALVRGQGVDYLGSSTVLTNAEGQFSLPVRKGSQSLVSARANGLSHTYRFTTSSSNLELNECLVIGASSSTITLTWGEHPRDLDTHFFGPIVDNDTRFHLFFANKEVENGVANYALDVDDVSSFGPEIVTISALTVPGRYRYAVHEFSGEGSIATSPARVELNFEGELKVFSAPAMPDGEDYETWVVFDIIVDDELNATLVEHNSYVDNGAIDSEFTVDAPSGTLKGSLIDMQTLPIKN